MSTNFENSNVKISEDVIMSIVTIALNEIEEIRAIEPNITNKITKQNPLTISFDGNSINVTAAVAVKYRSIINEVVSKAQENVVNNISIMTPLEVINININVVDIFY